MFEKTPLWQTRTFNITSATTHRVILPEPTITPERTIIWPQSQVGQHMLEPALHRAQWIRSNGTTSLLDIITEVPRLVDTPGMIATNMAEYLMRSTTEPHTF